jgi:AcrR family transcriptional regulator
LNLPETPIRTTLTDNGQTRRRQASRRKLMEAAGRLFVERGFDATRPQDIARSAGVASGTFYLHFQDKEGAFLAFAEQAQNDLMDQYAARLAGVVGLGPRLQVILRTMVEYAQDNPGVLQAAFLDPVMIAPNDEDAWRIYDRISEFTNLALGIGTDDDPSASLISHGLCGYMRHAMIYAGRKQLDLEQVIHSIVNFVEAGMGPNTKKGSDLETRERLNSSRS